jgi:hypothetical protein
MLTLPDNDFPIGLAWAGACRGTGCEKERSMTKRRLFVLIGGMLIAFLVVCVPAFAQQDPFSGLTNTLNSSARNWAAALMLVGALIAGGAIMMGSHESGRHTRNFLFGAIFLVLAGAGLAIYDKVAGLLG